MRYRGMPLEHGHSNVRPYTMIHVCAANLFHISFAIGMKLDICKQHEVHVCKIYFLCRLIQALHSYAHLNMATTVSAYIPCYKFVKRTSSTFSDAIGIKLDICKFVKRRGAIHLSDA